jgi:D-alanyl-lipoteichoic acid acyltransferase DltB (MBOAT superfamily)
MLFNSIDFALFLPVVFVLYWFVCNKNLKLQNAFIVAASYFFYGFWDWRFLSLILFSTFVDYTVGKALSKTENIKRRKFLLWTSIGVNLGFLGVFKYYNFFAQNFTEVFTFMGSDWKMGYLDIILPVGISFYTFQTLSYTIDIYRGKLKPTHDFITFAAFVSFFPQLVAGPIERATHLLPQFYVPRKFEYHKAVDGMRQILWGLFKKIVIADNCAQFANEIFNNSSDFSGSTLVLGAILFTFQIYGDFSGYSDIAIGTARLFGFDLKQNFAFPYFSRDIAEFWRRWHISLSTWFRDYVYIPLGGSRGGVWAKVRNTFIIFLVSGFWHGANWTFIAWGFLNALYFLPLLLTNRNRRNVGVVAAHEMLPSFKDFINVMFTFTITVFAWIFFRADTIGHAIQYIGDIFTTDLFEVPKIFPKKIIILIILFLCIEWFGRSRQYALENFAVNKPKVIRWTLYIIICFLILISGGEEQDFIYFQF